MGDQRFYRLEIVRGDAFAFYVAVWDGNRSLGVLKDFTGYTAAMQVRDTADSTVILLAPTVTLGEGTTTDKNNQPRPYNVLVEATQLQTAALDFTHAPFDAQWTDPSGHTWTFMRGIAELYRDVTR